MQQFQKAGILTPEVEQHINAGVSEMGKVKGSKEGKDASLNALKALQERGKSGYTLQEKAEMNRALTEADTAENARQQAILQRMQAQGMGGSGASLAAQLASSQGTANRQSQQALDIASQGQQRALESMMRAGNLGSDIDQREFGQESQKAQAQDIFNKLNYENQVATQQRNVAAKNQAQQYNLANDQSLSNANTQQANQEKMRQKAAQQDYWNSRLQQAGGQAAAQNNASKFYSDSAKQQADAGASTAAGVGSGIKAIGGLFTQSKNEGITAGDVSDPELLKKMKEMKNGQ